MCACEENKTDIVEVLLEKGATVAYQGKVNLPIESLFSLCL